MAKRFGNDDLVWVNRSGTFYPILGQQNLSQNESTATIDTSDKTTGGYDTQAPGNTSVQITFDVTPNYPDVNGFEWVDALKGTKTAEIFQVRKGGLAANGTTDVQFEGPMYVLGRNKGSPKNGIRTVSITLALAGEPTINRTT